MVCHLPECLCRGGCLGNNQSVLISSGLPVCPFTNPSCQVKHGRPPDVVGISTVTSACAAAKAWNFALLIFEFSEVTNPITCGAALNACDKGSQWQLGLVFWLR